MGSGNPESLLQVASDNRRYACVQHPRLIARAPIIRQTVEFLQGARVGGERASLSRTKHTSDHQNDDSQRGEEEHSFRDRQSPFVRGGLRDCLQRKIATYFASQPVAWAEDLHREITPANDRPGLPAT